MINGSVLFLIPSIVEDDIIKFIVYRMERLIQIYISKVV